MPFRSVMKGTLEKPNDLLDEEGPFEAFFLRSLVVFRKCEFGQPTARAVSGGTKIARFLVRICEQPLCCGDLVIRDFHQTFDTNRCAKSAIDHNDWIDH